MILRYSPLLSRTAPNLLASAAKCKPPHSQRFFPSCSVKLSLGLRSYATKRPSNESKDETSKSKNSSQKDEIAHSESAKSSLGEKPGKPARGVEYLYTNSNLSIPPTNKKVTLESLGANMTSTIDGFTKLTPEQEQFLENRVRMIISTLPKSLGEDVARAFAEIKKHGSPPELISLLKDLQDGKPMSLSMAARIVRISNEFARKAAENGTASDKSSSQGKKDGPSARFFSQDKNKKEDKSNPPKRDWFSMSLENLATFAVSGVLLWLLSRSEEQSKDITWQEFRASLLSKGLVEKLQVINNNRVKVYVHRDAVERAHPDSPAIKENFFYTFTIGSTEGFERKLDEAQQELGIPNNEQIPVSYTTETSAISAILSFTPTLLMIAFTVWLWRRASGGAGGGGNSSIFGMGKTRAKKYSHETAVQVKFKDVAGADEAKQEIMEFVSFLKDPGRFEKLGAKIPRGAILSGPPGTGKTLLAKATAGESGVPFFSCSGSEFIEVFVGIGPSRVRDLFAQARKNTPCIIFIDEIDAIGKSRSKQSFGGGNDEREATLNQILTEMDGFNTTDQVVVLAGTNRPDVLDPALMRPGRFDRHIAIDRPTLSGRKQIFSVYLPKIRTDEDIDFLSGRLSSLTPGFSGADIANCVNEAALIAARLGATKVVMNHFEQAIERTVAGLEKKSLVLDPEEKKVVAYHEAGHAICGWFFKHADPLLKVSIIPRGQGALGYAMNVPVDRYLMNVNQMMDRMAMILGGRVSEELHFETVTSGASDDFNKVTRMATAMVTKYGMSQKIGYLFYEDDDNKLHKPFSEETSRNIDLEVRRIVSEAYDQCKRLLTEKKKEVGLIAEELLSKEVLDRDDMIRLLGKRPWQDNKEFDKYFGARKSAPPPPDETITPIPDPSIPPPPSLPPNPDTPGAPVVYRKLE